MPSRYRAPSARTRAHEKTGDSWTRSLCEWSELHPTKSAAKTWNWHHPRGRLKNKHYDYLLLVGDKDGRFPDDHRDGSPYMFFRVAQSDVSTVTCVDDKHVKLGTRLETAKNRDLANCLVPEDDISALSPRVRLDERARLPLGQFLQVVAPIVEVKIDFPRSGLASRATTHRWASAKLRLITALPGLKLPRSAMSSRVPPGTMIVAGTFLVTFRNQRYDGH